MQAAAGVHETSYATLANIRSQSNESGGGEVGFMAHRLQVQAYAGDEAQSASWMKVVGTCYQPAHAYDVIFMRQEPPVDEAFITATRLLDIANEHTPVMNNPTALRSLNEKLSIFNFPDLILPTWVGCCRDAAYDFYQQHESVVLKPLDKMGGQGVYLSPPNDLNFNSVFELLSNGGQSFVMAQQCAPRAAEGDRRVFVVCGEPLDWVLVRRANATDFRANMAAGGTHCAEKIDDEHRAIALQVGAFLKTQNVAFAGLDVVGGMLTEINITCPTGLATIRTHTGDDIAAETLTRMLASIVTKVN